MRILRAAGVLVGLVAAVLGAVPAIADQSGPSVDLTVGWGTSDTSGGGTAAEPSWIPFTTLINIPTGRSDWTGTLVISRRAAAGGEGAIQQNVSVRPGTPRSVVVYGPHQADSTTTYEAVLSDSNGAQVAISRPATLRTGYATIGILSDAPSADSFFRGVVFGQASQSIRVMGHHFDKVESLPSNALALTGFHALVIDDFDSSSLSQAQARALQDYVGFGGSLVISGGTGWRRTLAQLPAALVPLRPDSTGTASMNAVMELSGGTSELTAPLATGTLAPGARVVLADANGIPLMAESSYGSGRILELTYDPALDPLFGTSVATEAWTQVINRAVSVAKLTRANPTGQVPVPIGVAGATTGSVVPASGGGLESQVFGVLANSPASALPPVGLLGALLVGYVILAGPANYLWVSRRRRRELTWVTVPLIAVLFTGAVYGAGIAYRGSDYVVNEIQLLRVAPGGSVDATMLYSLFSPHRGDFVVQAPDASFAATAGGSFADRVNPGRHPTLALNGLAVWEERSIKVEAPVRPGINIETHLGISGLSVKGTITNRGTNAVHDLGLLTVSGEWASLAPSLAPGATVTVDRPLGRIPDYSGRLTTGCTANVPAGCKSSASPAALGAAPLSDAARTTFAEVAAGATVMGRTDIQALVGTVDPLPGITIGDRSPNRHSIAAVAEPVLLETLDTLPAGWAGARLVASFLNTQADSSLDVWDFDLPARVGGTLVLHHGTPGEASPSKPASVHPTPATVEVYDWSTRRWSRLASDVVCPGSTTFCSALLPEQSANGLVRVRTRNNAFDNLQLQLLSTNGAGT